MRRFLIGLAVAAATALAPLWAFAGNQEVADQIAARLKASGQMHGYKIAVKYQVGVSEIIALNPQIANPALIYPDQIIKIPLPDAQQLARQRGAGRGTTGTRPVPGGRRRRGPGRTAKPDRSPGRLELGAARGRNPAAPAPEP